MKRFIVTAMLLTAAAAGGVVFAQSRSDADGEALQRKLEEAAIRIPAEKDEMKTRAAAPSPARTVPRSPDLPKIREELRRTREADAERRRALTDPSQGFAAALSLPAPPPGVRALPAGERLASIDPSEVERALVPVLVPDHADVRDKIKVYGMRNIYTATAEIDANASLSITGTCNRVIGGAPETAAARKRLADGPVRRMRSGVSYHISRNDFGVDLSFSRFGCGYVMTIECGNPADDARCAEDDYITSLADSMILANPELAEGE